MRDYLVKYDDLSHVTKEMFIALGYSERQASIVTHCLVEADARHLHSHGVASIKTYMEHVKGGSLKLNAAAPSTLFETDKSLVLDGHSGVGYAIADTAVRKTIEKAKKAGVCITTVRQANHYGFVGHWTEIMAKEKLIGVSSTNTVRCVCPTRSAERNLGTNPISVAFPTVGDEKMFLLDMATTVMAHGKLCRSQVFAESGVVPDDVIIDGEGNCVTNFNKVLDILANGDVKSAQPKGQVGGLLPLGGHTEIHSGYKGYALALLVELLTGGLSGGTPSKFIPLASEGICFFFMAIDPALFGERTSVLTHVKYIIDEYRKSAPIDPNLPVLIPGDKECDFRERSIRDGIFLSPEIIEQMMEVAAVTGKETALRAVLIER